MQQRRLLTPVCCRKVEPSRQQQLAQVAGSVLKNKGADPESQQAAAAGAGAKRSAAASNAASALFVVVGAAAAVLVLYYVAAEQPHLHSWLPHLLQAGGCQAGGCSAVPQPA
jgi:hypothetical protein